MNKKRILILGGDLSALSAALRAAENGYVVSLFSPLPLLQAFGPSIQEGISFPSKKERGDNPEWEHFSETLYGGDFLSSQNTLREMCFFAPQVLPFFSHLGVPFFTSEGSIHLEQQEGSKSRGTAYAGFNTGFHLLKALDLQLRKYEAKGLVQRFEFWEFWGMVLDGEGIFRGISALHVLSQEVEIFYGDALIVATSSPLEVFGKTAAFWGGTGIALPRIYSEGASYANPEFIQFHPTAFPGPCQWEIVGDWARARGARIWTYQDGRPWYFLEEWYPAYGSFLPKDLICRAIYKVIYEKKIRIDGQTAVHLDFSHLSPQAFGPVGKEVLGRYEKFTGEDPWKNPMKVSPAAYYSVGGLHVDEHHKSNIPGVYAAGEACALYHGANLLGGNAPISSWYGGILSADSACQYMEGALKSDSSLTQEKRKYEEKLHSLQKLSGTEDPSLLWEDLKNTMELYMSLSRSQSGLLQAQKKLMELKEKAKNLSLPDSSNYGNASLVFCARLPDYILFALMSVEGALQREESRGVHFRSDYPERNDEDFLKTTIASFQGEKTKISYQPLEGHFLSPRTRGYEV